MKTNNDGLILQWLTGIAKYFISKNIGLKRTLNTFNILT